MQGALESQGRNWGSIILVRKNINLKLVKKPTRQRTSSKCICCCRSHASKARGVYGELDID